MAREADAKIAKGEGGPLTVIDTHAGRGLYDLAGVEAKKSGEAEAGIVRLMAAKDAPAAFAPAAFAQDNIFVWSGHNYAIEPVTRMGLMEKGGVLRVEAAEAST